MKKIKVLSFFLIFMCCSVAVFAVKTQDIPPWMEDIEKSGRGTYLVPKGAKRKVIGSQVIVEAPNEYVARRLYEMEGYLRRRFQKIEERQEKFQEELEGLKKSIGKLEKDNKLGVDLEGLKNDVKKLNEFKRAMEERGFPEAFIGKPDESGIGETAEDSKEVVEEEEKR